MPCSLCHGQALIGSPLVTLRNAQKEREPRAQRKVRESSKIALKCFGQGFERKRLPRKFSLENSGLEDDRVAERFEAFN